MPTSPITLPLLRAPSRPGTRLRPRPPVLVLAGLVLAVVAVVAGAMVAGLSCFIVESPSMGRAAPVGTLVIDERPDPAHLRVGDVVTYRAPDRPGTVTHRIVELVGGGFRARGDINGGGDARTVAPSMVIGRAVVLLPGVGWLVRLAPWLSIGALSVWALTLPITSDAIRAAARLVGLCAVVASALLVLRPLIGWTVLSQTPVGHGMRMTVVPTGLLPVRLAAAHGESVVAQPGEVVRLLLPADHAGRVLMTSAAGLEPVGWIVLAVVCLLPLVGVLAVGLPPGRSAES